MCSAVLFCFVPWLYSIAVKQAVIQYFEVIGKTDSRFFTLKYNVVDLDMLLLKEYFLYFGFL